VGGLALLKVRARVRILVTRARVRIQATRARVTRVRVRRVRGMGG
jgi:hypothetical protein